MYLLATALPLAGAAFANLEYEYALFASYLALLLIPAAAFVIPLRHLPGEDGQYRPNVALEVFWTFLISPAIALLSGLYMFATGLCTCSETGFAFWMALLWYPAWILAHAIHHGIARARVVGIRRRKVLATVVASYGALLSVVALKMWFAPQKRIVDLLTGFLHGPIYDDWIAVDNGIVLARSAHLALAVTLLCLAWWRRRTVNTVMVALFATIWLVVGLIAGNFQSTRNGKDALDQLLSGKLEGKGFSLHYQPTVTDDGKVDSKTPQAMLRLFRDAEFHVGELSQVLGEKDLPKVEIYVYPNDDKKKLWFGGGATDVTDVRTPSVHVSLGSWPHPTLRHELAHALTSGFAFHGLGFHPNMAFTEGLAVALAPEQRSLTLDDGAAALIKDKRLPPMAELFSPAFWKVSGSRAYTAAGSFIRFLIAVHGMEGVKKLYAGADWQEAFGKNRDDLIAAWAEHVTKAYDPEKNAIFAEALFRRPGILEDLCPHSKVDLARDRDEGAYVRMRQPIGWDPAGNYLAWLTELAPEDQSVRLKVWRREIKKVAAERFAGGGRLQTWREALSRARTTPAASLEDVETGILESDVARALGDVDGSLAILTELTEQGRKRYFGDSLAREIEARLAIEASAGAQAFEWRRYLAGFRKTLPDSSLSAGPWILTYLKVRNLRTLTGTDLSRLLVESPPDASVASSFHVEWYRVLAERLMRQDFFADAATAYDRASAAARPASQEIYAEHARRARYLQ